MRWCPPTLPRAPQRSALVRWQVGDLASEGRWRLRKGGCSAAVYAFALLCACTTQHMPLCRCCAGERRQQQPELKEHQNKFFQQFDLDGDGKRASR